ncbi:hypothetical protein RND81_06G234500 [Saponaria officinalis]|uniref:EF-hand domain-containing protein n=1 Tax=Saponaria officinalis TaxID=3572 RepID=A0AAW1KDI0_SAPOF
MGKEYVDDQHLASMREAFALFDTDGDGMIDPSDLGAVMRSLGSNPTQAQLCHIVEVEKLSNPFDFTQFLGIMTKHMKPDDPFESDLRHAFRVLDKESSGFVSVSDLRHILTNIGEKLEPQEFDEWIQDVDVGSDGRFEYEEFISQLLVK